MSLREAEQVQMSTNGALGRLCWYRKYYRSTQEAVLVQQSIIGALGRLC